MIENFRSKNYVEVTKKKTKKKLLILYMIIYIRNVMLVSDLCDVWFYDYMMDRTMVGHHYQQ
jgi:hypothetical protein